ncbi:unnamed protein product [Parascedosporium putredinis]|uniref:Polyketide synthase n=1 Tax=Parascedosporium putredinis TaxID=1442378 RepID=A0A9P1MBC8_9PEZI|nr:unnamed protein product [Parascedosporium putredinis]CAI7995691.1 unnamed protein product [Parascedosporium putredinis]
MWIRACVYESPFSILLRKQPPARFSEMADTDKMAFLLFGDQSLDTHGFLAEFCRQGNPSILAKAFMERASHALRDEVDRLSKLERANIPSFKTLYQLNEKYYTQERKHPGIDSALLCIAQLAHYIDRVEKTPEQWTRHDQTFFVGFCTGLFAASAIASTPTVSTLIPLAIQTVLLAFRTGSYAGALAERLSPLASGTEPWTMIFPGVGEEEATKALLDLSKSKPRIRQRRSPSSIAISGPPTTLRTVVEQRLFGSNPLTIPVYAPYHAPHLHASVDIEELLQLDSPEMRAVMEDAKPRSPLMSSNGTWFKEETTRDLLKAVVWECLNEPLRFSQAFESCAQAAKSFRGRHCLIIPHGPTQAAETLAKVVEAETTLVVDVVKGLKIHKESIGSSIGNHGPQLGRCRLAIVGMAGRFPDAASHEKLWELLAKGLDVHRVVPKDRFPVETHVDPTGKAVNTSHTPYGCWIEEPGLFDPRFFNMSPREAFQTDPMQRMAMTTAYEALEMSGYVPNRTPSTQLDRIGTFYGQTSDDWREINAAQEGPCATFDNGADGYCRADACASVIVKRLDDALAEKDNVLAVILGTSTNHSADAISITHPHGPTQSVLSRAILDEAGVDPLDVDYVEMHGTGTQAGDGTEMVSVTNVFAPAKRKRPADRPLYLGAVKNLSERNVNIAFHMTPFVRNDGKPRKIFVNNFSAAGGNTGLLLEEAPKYEPALEDPRSTHIITVTGKSKSAMIRNAEGLVAWMDKNPSTPVSHVAYSTTARRIQHYWRMNVAASDLSEAQVLIKDRLKENFVPISTEQPKRVQEAINEFNKLALLHQLPSFLPLIDGSEPDVQKLSPVVVQLGLCCFEMALARLWESWGVRPGAVLGHSLGEYAALNVAGVLSASDTIYLVGSRAQLLIEKCTAGTHAMLAVQGPVSAETVLSGTAEEIVEISELLSTAGYKCTQLKVPFAFHSAQVEPILDDFEYLSQSVVFQRPKVAVVSPLLGKLVEQESINPAYLRNHARDAVDFLGALVSAQEAGVIDEKTVWLEVGPHPVCSNMIKAAFGASTIAVPTLRRNEATYKILHASLCTLHSAGLNIDWTEYHKDFEASVRLLDLPTYSFDYKNYWIQYTGDWCLTKNRVGTKPAALMEAPKPKISTSAVHKVTKEEVKGDTCIIETETNLSREDIRGAVSGHVVNGAPLFPSTIYAEMGMTICDYAYKLVRPEAKNIGVNIYDVEVPKTLIFNESLDAHILRCTATCYPAKGTAELVFHTVENGKKVDHCFCKVTYEDPEEWLTEFDRVNYLIKSRVDHLLEAEKVGKASKIGRGLAYKLFSALVDYDAPYRGMEEVVLDSDTCEATAKIVFPKPEKPGNWFFNPYWLDSCCHISGFIVNGTDAVDSREQVFISHGWGYLKLAEKLNENKTYRSYIRMQPIRGTKMMSGDAYIFDGDRIVGVVGQIKFQSIPRKVLNMVLPRGKALAGMAAPAPAGNKAPVAASKRPAAKEKTKQVTPATIGAVNAKLRGSVVAAVLDILAKEVGVSEDELADNIAFTDLGVDSLMSLTVSGRIKEDLDLDIDNHVFVDHATIGAFKKYLAKFETPERKESVSSSGESNSTGSDSDTPEIGSDSDITTPLEGSEDGSVKGGESSSSDLQDIVRGTISEEMGVEVDEIIAAPDLVALGMDSLMSLSILGTLREKTGLDIPSDLLTANTSLVAPAKLACPTAAAAAAAAPRPSRIINTHPGNTTATIVKPPRPTSFPDTHPHRKATSVLLQGSVRTSTKNLFMIPDGSGCATSYTEISAISPDWAVWGMFSPFMKTPEEFNCGVYGMAQKFITEVKRRQPTGPYSFAGWSAGGVIAFEMVNQLVKAGDVVDNLIIIDAPCPVTIEPLPRSLHSWFATIGLLGDGDSSKIPHWLLPHFAASVTALSNYTAEAIPDDKCPRVTAIWCEDGVCKLPTDPRPDPYPTGHALFLLDNRTDFGPNRWDEYLDYNKIQTAHMPGNHFSMMHGDLAKRLGDIIRQAVTDA